MYILHAYIAFIYCIHILHAHIGPFSALSLGKTSVLPGNTSGINRPGSAARAGRPFLRLITSSRFVFFSSCLRLIISLSLPLYIYIYIYIYI